MYLESPRWSLGQPEAHVSLPERDGRHYQDADPTLPMDSLSTKASARSQELWRRISVSRFRAEYHWLESVAIARAQSYPHRLRSLFRGVAFHPERRQALLFGLIDLQLFVSSSATYCDSS